MNADAELSCAQVEEAVKLQFDLQTRLEVTIFGKGTFLLSFGNPHTRQRVLAEDEPVRAGRTTLRIMPWTRLSAAEAGKLYYQAKVFLEGVPRHAWQPEAVKNLFHRATLIHGEETFKLQDKEKACYCLKLWTTDPGLIPKSGTLKVEEPEVEDAPPMHHPELGIEDVPERTGPLPTLDYSVLIHLAEVLDYSPLPDPISGLPSEAVEDAWPQRFPFACHLGVMDGQRPSRQMRAPEQQQRDWSGDRRWDRSPPGENPLEKRGRGEGGRAIGPYGHWVGGESSRDWHYRGDSQDDTVGNRRRARYCPPESKTATPPVA